MGLNPGTKLGTFEIVELIGVGGMGEVYRARDTRLGREVAIKVLPAEVANDPDRMARFEREAKLLASLDHPNIGALHEFRHADGVHFLVLQLVEGETLADRLKRGALAINEALPLFVQIAEALEAAHEQGIVHRDLKPANIKITQDDKVKVLDFGIAKSLTRTDTDTAWTPPPSSPDATTLPGTPTPPTSLTGAEMIVGTPSYMSPEQARGKKVDKRSDIWAFGCCLYQTLTGAKAFDGETVADIIGSITRGEPDFDTLPPQTPPGVRHLLERCLRKDPNRRLRDIGDARIDLQDAIAEQQRPEPVSSRRVSAGGAFMMMAGGLALGLLLAFALFTTGTRDEDLEDAEDTSGEFELASTSKEVRRYPLAIPQDMPHAPPNPFDQPIAVSPDGTRLVYNALFEGRRVLVLHRSNALDFLVVSGSDRARFPVFSPDGEWLSMLSQGGLYKLPVGGGTPTRLADVSVSTVRDWADDGYIYFTASFVSGIRRVKSSGGEVETVTTMKEGEIIHTFPQLLPGGRTLLYSAFTAYSPENGTVMAHNLETGEEKVLLEGVAGGYYLPTGHLRYVDGDRLMVRTFDLNEVAVIGPGIDVTPHRLSDPGEAPTKFHHAASGTLAYVPREISAEIELVWIDMQGNEEASGLPAGEYWGGRVSPDGTRIAFFTSSSSESDIWTYDLSRGTATRYTFTSDLDTWPTWTSDGEQLIFNSVGQGQPVIQRVTLATGLIEILAASSEISVTAAISGDGNTVLFRSRALGSLNVHALDISTGTMKPVLESQFDEKNPVLSPDGHWLAYNTDETGAWEVFVVSYPEVNQKTRVSPKGGEWPLWSPDGTKLYYRNEDDIMVVDVELQPRFSAGRARTLLSGLDIIPPMMGGNRAYDLSPDGTRFLLPKPSVQGSSQHEIIVVENWFEEVKRLAPLGDTP